MHFLTRALTFSARLELEPLRPLALVERVRGLDLHDVDAVGPQVGDLHLVDELVLLRVEALLDDPGRRQLVLVVRVQVQLVALDARLLGTAGLVLLADPVVVRQRALG